jgi:replication factor C subunit 3/5
MDQIRAEQPFVEKYRPNTLDDLISHTEIVEILQRFIRESKLPHLLFHGPPGTGKTSTILACAKMLFGTSYKQNILELNASDDRGIDVVRSEIKDFAGTKRLFDKGVKLIILDEADNMTNTAQFALRRVMEKYTSNARFCLICNYVNKIIPALQSRCTKFRFGPLHGDQIVGRLRDICEAERLSMDEEAEEALVDLSQGDMRRVLNLLQATALANESSLYSPDGEEVKGREEEEEQRPVLTITKEELYQCAGAPLPSDMEELLQALLGDSSFSDTCALLERMEREQGYALGDILSAILPQVMEIDFPAGPLGFLLDELSNLELRLSKGGEERLNSSSLVGVFAVAKNMMASSPGASSGRTMVEA